MSSQIGKLVAITLLWFCLIRTAGSEAPPPDHEIQLLASDASWPDQEYVGHAFMIISTRLSSGVKEDAYGFYPQGGGLVIHGPGVVASEMERNPARFSRVVVSIRRPLTDLQRTVVLKLVAEWNTKQYALTNQSCIDFVAAVAQAVGMKLPPRTSTDLPAAYLAKLKSLNP